ncbi:MAG: Na(+)-translocating NADH-quinone reductase subunit C [Pirellulaceae bacterium]
MVKNRDSITNTILVALGVCLVCATLVSVAAVGLRSMQQTNKLKDKKKNILAAAGLMENDPDVNELYDSMIMDRIVNLKTGQDVTEQFLADHPEYETAADFDQIDVAESEKSTEAHRLDQDPATIKWQENHSHVYIVRTSSDDDTPAMYVFPIRGKGLWSILKGFIALDADLETIQGITYYEHAETPGLGGEVDNPEWKASWQGKLLYDENGKVAMRLLKTGAEGNPHAVDSLSGATITARGVEKMLEFWMSDTGFEPYLRTLTARESAQ